ncbi:hypothetical protein ANOM_000628 [Aspergillus nomiae NRRL 13137]|uniref:Uncharacterized protein n=1 Tax=Aspergillus nomiae NRRL (strain ATCC 15546 / NRRL 13137 / CBS 260.88 / M93) TaxID=1509407 RepID=A0A0L1JHE3_ASPN3|nr:uncharacterized protein ANOM_000628 [Aspergillus nomiae NRRL 13137]KNG91190.1 hypothetical protein ANOM_000628 [Aspergillus nomiae NRRL 13137]
MDSTSDPSPPYSLTSTTLGEETLPPTTLILSSKLIHTEAAPSTPLYEISRDIASLPQKFTSVKFERIETDAPSESGSKSPEPQKKLIFYLAHPAHARYRKDVPAYYITAVSLGSLGNIRFEVSKSRFQKAEFRALLSAGKSMDDKPLFCEDVETTLFTAKMKWTGGGYRWTDARGREVAFEGGKGDGGKLAVTASMEQDMRDALVALWVLRTWYETAESSKAKADELAAWMPPSAYAGMDFGAVKKSGALGALGALGGGGA